MTRLWTLLALLALTISSFAQTPAPPDPRKLQELNTKVIAALTAKKYDEGIALLNETLALQPNQKGTAYNMACAYSLKGDIMHV